MWVIYYVVSIESSSKSSLQCSVGKCDWGRSGGPMCLGKKKGGRFWGKLCRFVAGWPDRLDPRVSLNRTKWGDTQEERGEGGEFTWRIGDFRGGHIWEPFSLPSCVVLYNQKIFYEFPTVRSSFLLEFRDTVIEPFKCLSCVSCGKHCIQWQICCNSHLLPTHLRITSHCQQTAPFIALLLYVI